MKNNSLKEKSKDKDFLVKLIPEIEKMIEKESTHLFWLQSKNAPNYLIENSKCHLKHLKKRYEEYLEYAKKEN